MPTLALPPRARSMRVSYCGARPCVAGSAASSSESKNFSEDRSAPSRPPLTVFLERARSRRVLYVRGVTPSGPAFSDSESSKNLSELCLSSPAFLERARSSRVLYVRGVTPSVPTSDSESSKNFSEFRPALLPEVPSLTALRARARSIRSS
eukprot:scaffold38271_cov29-Tisochrysis_lutea.AAC.3